MTVLLYIFAMIGAVVTVAGIIGIAFDISQSRDDMAYWIHTRFPEFEKEVNAKLYAFEEKLKKPADEIYIEKDAYDLDWHEIQEELRVINNRLDNHEKVFVTRKDYSRQTEELIQRCNDNDLKIATSVERADDVDACIKSIRSDIDRQNYNIDAQIIRIDALEHRIAACECMIPSNMPYQPFNPLKDIHYTCNCKGDEEQL